MSRRVHTAATIRPGRRRFLHLVGAIAVALAASTAGVLATATPAFAHDELIGSDPEAGAALEALPAAVTLTFNAAVLADEGATEVRVTDPGGAEIQVGAAVVDDATVTQAISADPPANDADYTVAWKVVSDDGHPISGEFTFTVAGSPVVTPTETATPTPSETSAASSSPSEAPAPDDSGSAWIPWAVGGVIALLVLAAGVYLLASRDRRSTAPGASEPGQEPPADR